VLGRFLLFALEAFDGRRRFGALLRGLGLGVGVRFLLFLQLAPAFVRLGRGGRPAGRMVGGALLAIFLGLARLILLLGRVLRTPRGGPRCRCSRAVA